MLFRANVESVKSLRIKSSAPEITPVSYPTISTLKAAKIAARDTKLLVGPAGATVFGDLAPVVMVPPPADGLASCLLKQHAHRAKRATTPKTPRWSSQIQSRFAHIPPRCLFPKIAPPYCIFPEYCVRV